MPAVVDEDRTPVVCVVFTSAIDAQKIEHRSRVVERRIRRADDTFGLLVGFGLLVVAGDAAQTKDGEDGK